MKEKMKNLRKSRKALSPVVASIILIAVTVAVSIAVAAWMGALTIGFMGGSEQVEIRTITFSGTDTATLTVRNTGTSAVSIQEVWVNNGAYLTGTTAPCVNATLPFSIAANTNVAIKITMTSWTAGDNYQFKLVTAKGNPFMKNAVPPS
jgi:flagellin-like protein